MSQTPSARTLLHGVNTTMLFEAKDALCAQHRHQGHTIHHLSTHVSDDLDQLNALLTNASLFDMTDDLQCCVLICPTAPNTTWINALKALPYNPKRHLCMVYHSQDNRYKKSAWFKQLSPLFSGQEFPIIYGQALQQWLTTTQQQMNIHLSSSQMRQLTTQTQGNQTLMKQVLSQCQYAFPKQNIPQDVFSAILNEVTPSHLYNILDQALLGHPLTLIEHYQKLSNEQQIALFWMTNQAVATIHQLKSTSPSKLPAWQVKKFHGLKQLPFSFWRYINRQLSICEQQLKGIHPGELSTTLSTILLTLARRR